jgi:hypothetical protein
MSLLRYHLTRFSTKHSTIDSNRISPLRKPSDGQKSG